MSLRIGSRNSSAVPLGTNSPAPGIETTENPQVREEQAKLGIGGIKDTFEPSKRVVGALNLDLQTKEMQSENSYSVNESRMLITSAETQNKAPFTFANLNRLLAANSNFDLDGVAEAVVSATVPDNIEALLQLLPPNTSVKDFLDALGQYFPGLDQDGNHEITMNELTDAMNSGKFPPLNLASGDGIRLLRMLTALDPQLEALVMQLCQCKNPEDYAMVNKQITGRVCELLQALYQGTGATIQDISTTDPWKSDDILFNGVVISLTHQVDNLTDEVGYFFGWNEMEDWLEQGPESVFDPHVGSDVGQDD